MIILFSDFGLHGPYIGQVKAVLSERAPSHVVIDLFADAPMFNIRCSAYLLAAYIQGFPKDSVFCAVVDPGVGSSEREPVILSANGYWFVGPDNGLFACVAASDPVSRCWKISWKPEHISATFHGRDIFAPVAAMLANGEPPSGVLYPQAQTLNCDWPDNYPAAIYIDHFGNVMTGLKADTVAESAVLIVAGTQLKFARTYNDVAQGQGFWYRNANGLVEIAIACGDAAKSYGIRVNDPVAMTT